MATDLDFSTKIVILDGQIMSVSRFYQSSWAWCIYTAAIRTIQPFLTKYRITGIIRIYTEHERLFLECFTGDVVADCEMQQAIDDRQRDFVYFHLGEVI